jgi:hypothetical protein
MQTSRVEMNYLKVYCNLIRKAEQRSYTKKKAKELGVYVEGHHTFPVSIFGKNKRIVYLTAREHYIAHALLEKICIKRYGVNHYRTHKMIYAFWCLNSQKSKNKYLNSYFYKSLRERYAEVHSKKMKIASIFIGDKNPSKQEKRRKEIGLRTKEYLISLSKEEYFEIFSKFKKVSILFSADGIEETFDYNRYPGKWDVFKNNLNQSLKYVSTALSINISYTVSIYSIFNIIESLEYYASISNKTNNLKVWFNLVNNEEYSIKNLPDELKEPLIKKLIQIIITIFI